MNCLIVDDDPVSRTLIGNLVAKTEWLNLVGSCASAFEASSMLSKTDVDLIFLDVEMPEMSGLELMSGINKDIDVIIITSKKEYAVDGFDHGVSDFLVKPVEQSRFLQACMKVRENQKEIGAKEVSHLFVKSGTSYIKILIEDLQYVESMGDYVALHVSGKRHLVYITMKETEAKLADKNFMRIHRSYIINLSCVQEIDDNAVVLQNKTSLPISRSYKKDLMERLKMF